jgi:hypothetical protein
MQFFWEHHTMILSMTHITPFSLIPSALGCLKAQDWHHAPLFVNPGDMLL